uniref:Uncharacterized protein n=1 Tax=Avena sativa TaxID=4498 RepID=A0ACD5TRE1_AVESA
MAAMDEDVRLDLDKLPIKRLEAIDEAGNEQYPPDTSTEEQRLAAIRRIDFSWVIERDAKKAKKAAEETAQQAWPWQGLMESLQQAQQELTVVLDLISTVEANDAVTVATASKPKSTPNEVLVDMAVSAATKLQRLRHLGRYFKQSAKTMEQQFQKEARFYGSLIRLQQNWKVKRQRGSSLGSESFMFDVIDTSQLDTAAMPRFSSMSLIPIDQDSFGTLSVQVPQKSFRFLTLQFRGDDANGVESYTCKMKGISSTTSAEGNDTLEEDDVNKSVKHAHSILRNIHKSIFEEQVFDMVIRETFVQSQGINVTGMREDFLQLAIGQESLLCLSLVHSSGQDSDSEMSGQEEHTNTEDAANLMLAATNGKQGPLKRDASGFLNPKSLEIYLLQMFHDNILKKVMEKYRNIVRYPSPAQTAVDDCGLLSHFCMTVSHRIFSNKVHLELESVVSRVPYLHLRSLPTWHSRTSSWSLCLRVPQPILASDRPTNPSEKDEPKYKSRSQFNTKIILKDGQLSLLGEGSPSIAGSLTRKASDGYLINSYNCDLEDLPTMLLQQVASQVINWLHEEALVLGMNVTRDFLCLYFDLDQGETLGLVAHVDPDDTYGCISWYLTIDHPVEDGKMSTDNPEFEKRRFLGYLSLEVLYSTLMDLINLCSTGVHR